MIRFESDYTQGAVPEIIEKLAETNMQQTAGYGMDEYCLSASQKIKQYLGRDDVDVHFLVGGTQTNLLFISSVLRPHQGVISADTGHIHVHETGAVESCGHKILTIPSFDGRISADSIDSLITAHYNDPTFEHTVQPKMVYISFPTENGAVYTKKELTDIYACCKKHGVYLYIDGARLGYALASKNCDLTMSELSYLCDAFYIGGTKVGALFGEALVIVNDGCKQDFRYIEKQKGAMLAKGRLLGLQFDVLFTDGLYEKVSHRAVDAAMKIREAFINKGIPLYYDSFINQQFPCLTDIQLQKLGEKFVFSHWCKSEDKTVVRFCTSWATDEHDVASLVREIITL